MENPLNKQPDMAKYVRAFWMRKWLVLAPIVVFPLGVGYYVMQLPDQYKSSTLILVQGQKVPTQFVPSTVTTNIEERLNTISQQILSRTRLEEIIQEFDLFSREKKAKLSPEEIVDLMRRKIELKVHRNDAFQLGYIDANPRLAMLVTNKLASLFIEENLKTREQQAIGTTQFLDDEIERLKDQVREKEDAIYSFKQKHMNELSEQVASNQARLSQLQTQLQINTQSINSSEDRKLTLQQQMASIERRIHDEAEERRKEGLDHPPVGPSSVLNEEKFVVDESGLKALEAELWKQNKELDRLKLTYTDRHPDVLRIASQVRRIEKSIASEKDSLARLRKAAAADRGRTSPPDAGGAGEAQPAYPTVYHTIKAEIRRADSEITGLRKQNQDIQRDIEVFQRRIAAAPSRELDMKRTSENYQNLKAQLDSLVNKKLQADLSENLEKKQKGEQFQVLDPANLPEKPFAPNRMRLLAGALAAGAALGFGLVFLLDLADLSIHTKEELAGVANLPVIGAIPEIVTPGDARRRKAVRFGISGGLAGCALVAAIVVHFAVKPLPQAVGDLVDQVRATHWTAMK